MRQVPFLVLLAACSPEPAPPAPAPSVAEAGPDARRLPEFRVDLQWTPPGAGSTQGGTTDPKNDIEKAFKEVDQSPGAR